VSFLRLLKRLLDENLYRYRAFMEEAKATGWRQGKATDEARIPFTHEYQRAFHAINAPETAALMREYLQNVIATRYDLPPAPAQPIPGGTDFLPGQPGQTLDVDRAVLLISDALRSPTSRSVALTFTRSSAARPTIDNLTILLKQIVTVSDFDGLIGFI
jgi:hypothetical protein